jgi:hypothetical protein
MKIVLSAAWAVLACVCATLSRSSHSFGSWTSVFDHGISNVEAAAATLHSMAGRLTALNMPLATAELMSAVQQASAALSKSLSSLSFILYVDTPEHDFHSAAQAVRGLAAGLQHVELGLIAESDHDQSWNAAEVQAADAAFEELICSLPSCQHLDLSLDECVFPEAENRALLHHAPHLLFVGLQSDHDLHEQVNSARAVCVAHPSSIQSVLQLDGRLRTVSDQSSQLNSVLTVALIEYEIIAGHASGEVHCNAGLEQADAFDSIARPERSRQQQLAGPYQRSASAAQLDCF